MHMNLTDWYMPYTTSHNHHHHQIEMQSHKRVKNKSLLYQLQIMRALNDLRT